MWQQAVVLLASALISAYGEFLHMFRLTRDPPLVGAPSCVAPPVSVTPYADLYVPHAASPHRETLVIFVHGGGWAHGTHKDSWRGGHAWVGRTLASGPDGASAAVVSYPMCARLWPSNVTVLTQLDSVAHSVYALVAHVRPRRLVLIGHSAGGHLASMLLARGDVQHIDTLIGVGGVYRPSALLEYAWPLRQLVYLLEMRGAFTPQQLAHDVSPARLLDAGIPAGVRTTRFVLITGWGDHAPLVRMADDLYHTLSHAGVVVARYRDIGIGHGQGAIYSREFFDIVRREITGRPTPR